MKHKTEKDYGVPIRRLPPDKPVYTWNSYIHTSYQPKDFLPEWVVAEVDPWHRPEDDYSEDSFP
jgi:hypothetical protein